jgi:hypothetical protein
MATSRAADAPLTLDFDRATAVEWGAAAGGVAFTQYFGQQQQQQPILAAGTGSPPPLVVRSDDAAADEADADAAAELHDSRPEPVPVSIIALGAAGAGKSTLLARMDSAEVRSPVPVGASANGDSGAADRSRALAAESSRGARGSAAADANAYRPTAGIDFRLRVRPWSSGVAVKLQVRGSMCGNVQRMQTSHARINLASNAIFVHSSVSSAPSLSDASLSALSFGWGSDVGRGRRQGLPCAR